MAGLTNAHVDPDTGNAYPNSQGATWADLTTWAAWSHWDANPYTSIEYVHDIDIGSITQFVPNVAVSAQADSYTVQESHSSDGTTWSDYADIGPTISARYLRIRVAAAGEYPVLQDMTAAVLVRRKEQVISDLDTATLTGAYRLGTGDIRVPIADGFSLITAVAVAFNSSGGGCTWELLDKETTVGPRVRLYDATGTPADAVIDINIKGA